MSVLHTLLPRLTAFYPYGTLCPPRPAKPSIHEHMCPCASVIQADATMLSMLTVNNSTACLSSMADRHCLLASLFAHVWISLTSASQISHIGTVEKWLLACCLITKCHVKEVGSRMSCLRRARASDKQWVCYHGIARGPNSCPSSPSLLRGLSSTPPLSTSPASWPVLCQRLCSLRAVYLPTPQIVAAIMDAPIDVGAAIQATPDITLPKAVAPMAAAAAPTAAYLAHRTSRQRTNWPTYLKVRRSARVRSRPG